MSKLKRTEKTSFKEEVPKLLEYLRETLEFEPTTLDLKDLYRHLRDSVILFNRDRVIDEHSIGDATAEAVTRFLHYDYRLIKDTYDLAWQVTCDQESLISRMKQKQAERHHWE